MEIMNFIFKHPQIKEDYLFRDKIINKLIKNKDKKLILLKAPFGYGKTVALSMFYKEINDKKLWINCPAHLFEFDDFLNHLIYGLSNVYEFEFSKNKNIYLYFNEEEKIVELVNELSKVEEDIYIFVDSLENMTLAENYKSLFNILINFSNKNVHYVFSSREDFPISVVKLEMSDDYYEIKEKELRFSLEEFKEYLNQRKIEIDEEKILELYELSNGWPGFINVIITYITDNQDINGNYISSVTNISEYLEAIIKNLSKDLKEFLFFISLLNQITLHVCKEYFSYMGEYKIHQCFERLLDLNIIEKLDEENFYMHDIFKQEISKKVPEDLKKKIYNELFEIYKKSENYKEQFYCLIQLGDIEKIIDFFLIHSQILVRDFSSVEKWLHSIPQSFYENDYTLYFYRGIIKEKYSKFDEALEDYIIVRNNIEKLKDTKLSVFEVEIQIIGIYWHKEEYEKVVGLGLELFKKIPDDDYNDLISLYNLLGTSLAYLSRIEEGEEYLNRALFFCEKNKINEMKPWILNNLAYNIYMIKGELKKAQNYYLEALEMFKNLDDDYGKALLYANLTDFYLLINNASKAQEMLDFFRDIYIRTQNIAYLPILNILQARIDLIKGSLKEADNCLKTAEKFYARSKFLSANFFSVKAEYLFKIGRNEEALLMIDKAIKIGSTFFNRYQILDVELQKVKMLIYAKQFESALPIIENAIKVASEGGTKLILVEALYYKIALSYFIKVLTSKEDQRTFLTLLEANDFHFIFEKTPYISKYVCEILGDKLDLSDIYIDTQIITFSDDSFTLLHGEKESSYYPKIHLFNEFRLISGENMLTIKNIKNKKALDLFKFLTLNYNQWITQDIIIEYFWKDLPFDSARQNLYVALHDMRKRFKDMGLKDEYILSNNKNYKFNTDKPYYLDYEDFFEVNKEAIKLFNNKLYSKSKDSFLIAKKIYKNGLLPSNIYDDWAIPKINHAEKTYLQILSKLYLIEKENSIEKAKSILEEYLNIDPYSYEMNTEYIKLLLKQREIKKAVDYYNYIKELFASELGEEFTSKEVSNFIKEIQFS